MAHPRDMSDEHLGMTIVKISIDSNGDRLIGRKVRELFADHGNDAELSAAKTEIASLRSQLAMGGESQDLVIRAFRGAAQVAGELAEVRAHITRVAAVASATRPTWETNVHGDRFCEVGDPEENSRQMDILLRLLAREREILAGQKGG